MDLSLLLLYFIIILVSISIHEAAHALMSYRLGDDTAKLQGRVSLNPLRHLDPFMSLLLPMALAFMGLPVFGGAKPVQINHLKVKWGDYGMALIALAGPIANFIQAFVAFGVAAIALSLNNELLFIIGRIAFQVNLGFMLFNLIPIPPLDGSRVLYALSPESFQRILYQMERYGLILIMFVVLFANEALILYITKMSDFIQQIFANFFGLFI